MMPSLVFLWFPLFRHVHANTANSETMTFLLVHVHTGVVTIKQRDVHSLSTLILDELLGVLQLPGSMLR